jgi:hypothetical protein
VSVAVYGLPARNAVVCAVPLSLHDTALTEKFGEGVFIAAVVLGIASLTGAVTAIAAVVIGAAGGVTVTATKNKTGSWLLVSVGVNLNR